MNIKEIREKSINELSKDLIEKRSIAQGLVFGISVKQAKNHRELRNVKREIARIMTVVKEKNNI